MKKTLAAIALLSLGACGGKTHVASAAPADWRSLANAADRERIRTWRDVWMKAVAKASPSHAAEIAAAGVALQPDAALADPAPPPANYACRLYKLGGLTPANADFSVSPPRACRVAANDDGQNRLSVLDGPQRPLGSLYGDRGRRMIFLGSMILSDERKSMRYGTDTERNVVGIVERIGPSRWRLVLPSPRWEAMLEVIEITPAS